MDIFEFLADDIERKMDKIEVMIEDADISEFEKIQLKDHLKRRADRL